MVWRRLAHCLLPTFLCAAVTTANDATAPDLSCEEDATLVQTPLTPKARIQDAKRHRDTDGATKATFDIDSERWVGLIDVTLGFRNGDNRSATVLSINATGAQRQTASKQRYAMEQLRARQPGLPVYISGGSRTNRRFEISTRHLLAQCMELGLRCTRLSSVDGPKMPALLVQALHAMQAINASADELAAVVEDDTSFIDSFLERLALSVAELPANWEVFHLCPGDLHNRVKYKHHQAPAPFRLDLAFPIVGRPAASSPNGHVFLDWPATSLERNQDPLSRNLEEQGFLPGAPMAFLMKRSAIPTLTNAFQSNLSINTWFSRFEETQPIDVILRDVGRALPGRHFLAREPPLCRELYQSDHTWDPENRRTSDGQAAFSAGKVY